MTLCEIKDKLALKEITLPNPMREVTGVYIGDLLSWVMGRANASDAWITIMSNVNIVAVASLTDTACIILAEDVKLEDDVIAAAKMREINILSSDKPAYEIAVDLSKILS
jgi:serine kinase of HPr protein (carbohydrate metabolism regulator)